jgi:AcrR family transcriptional regulator
VAVEPIASRLGATKGSFYWHFANRDALLEAALLGWEQTDTEAVIELVAETVDPRKRLHDLLELAIGGHAGQHGNRVELALLATPEHPLVAPLLARVTQRRIGYLEQVFVELGFSADAARQRGLLAYTAYLGHAQLIRATPELAPAGPGLAAYVDATIETLCAL